MVLAYPDQMHLTDILAGEPLLEMAYSQKKAESVVTGLEKPINDHLLKLWTMPDSTEVPHWLTELLNWLDEVGDIILKPDNRRPSKRFYYRILFDEPFGGAEVRNVTSRLRRLQRQGYRFTTDASPADLAERLRAFHAEFSRHSAVAAMTEGGIQALLV